MNNYEIDSELSLDSDQPASRSIRKHLMLGGGALGLMVLALTYYFTRADAPAQQGEFTPPPAVVAVAKAKLTTMAPSSTLPGTVVSIRDAVIASETSGKIISVALVGDTVEAGQPLATIDAKNAEQQISQRKADLERLKSLYQYHKNYFARVNIDDERLGIPEIGIAELRSNMETAKADYARAKAALEMAETELERTIIKAPFSGRVVSQSIQPGEYAQIGSAIVRLVDTAALEVSAQVPAALVQPLQSGTPLEVTGFGKVIKAPMRALVPVGNEVSRTMELRISLANADFLVGAPVRVTLPTATEKSVVAVPRDAVILRASGEYVFIVDSVDKAHRRDVKLGYAQGDMVEVLGDVQAGDTVIIRGGERLRDGQVVKADTPTGASTSGIVSQAR